MTPWIEWLTRLAKHKKFRSWLVSELGPGALKAFHRWLSRVRHRQAAIGEADQIDGHFSGVIIDGKRHVVVWKDGEPVSAYPPVTGDLAEKLRYHTRKALTDPKQLATQRARRWAGARLTRGRRTDGKRAARGRRSTFDQPSPSGKARFGHAVDRMGTLLAELEGAPRRSVNAHDAIPAAPGIYLFHQDSNPIYVGQSRNLRRRLKQHTAPRSRQNDASFAFNLAKRSAAQAGLTVTGFRSSVESDPGFAEHFERARTAVAGMDVQFIELADPIERTLFEVYATLALGTEEFNSFETH